MKKIIKFFVRKIQFVITDLIYPNTVKLFFFHGKYNFGDVINPIVFEKFSGKKTTWVEPEFYNKENYLAIGSILEFATSDSIVWGSGFLRKDGKCLGRPKKICAVRGPLTREILLKEGIECPEIYGDPALLLPKIYKPKITQKYRLGVVPHYVDKNHEWLKTIQNDPSVKILDIQEKDPYKFIDDLLSCEKIASSSLHGVIVADAYEIPSIWIEFSDNVKGEGFKFFDYFQSVHRDNEKPLKVIESTQLCEIYSQFKNYKIEIDLDALYNAFPKVV